MQKIENNECRIKNINEIVLIKQVSSILLNNIDILTINYNTIETEVKKCLKIMKYYRTFIYDLNNNKVQNFSDRMKNVKQLEKIEKIELMVNNINNILKENAKNLKEMSKIVKTIN